MSCILYVPGNDILKYGVSRNIKLQYDICLQINSGESSSRDISTPFLYKKRLFTVVYYTRFFNICIVNLIISFKQHIFISIVHNKHPFWSVYLYFMLVYDIWCIYKVFITW